MKTSFTGADAVIWKLIRDGKSYDMLEGFTQDGGMFCFIETGRCSVEISGGIGFCEKTVEVLPIRDFVLSLPEHGYIDQAEESENADQKQPGRSHRSRHG